MNGVDIILGLIAAFGWYFGVGHLLLHHLRKNPSWIDVFVASISTVIVFFGVLTPWFALPAPVPLIVGILLSGAWVWIRPPLPSITWPRPSIYLFLCGMLLTLYIVSLIAFPDWSFDSLAYHRPFINDFAAYGQIPLPHILHNWVDHVTFVFPKGIETLFGLGEMLLPNSQGFLQLIILLATFGFIERIARKMGVNQPLLAGLLFLATFRMLDMTKSFMVEQTIFLLFIAFIDQSWTEEQKGKRGTGILLFLLAASITMAKINAIVYLGVALVVAFFFTRDGKNLLLSAGGMVVGIIATYALPIYRGVDIGKEFAIVQALHLDAVVPIGMRIEFIWKGLGGYVPTTIGIGLLAALLLLFFHPPSRRVTATLVGGTIAFVLAFIASNLFVYTYSQIFVYIFAFIGLTAIPLALVIDGLVNERFRAPLRNIGMVLVIIIAAIALWNASQSTGLLAKGFHLMGTADTYPHFLENIPNDPSTRLLFMHNINPITLGLEKATILDYTYYSSFEGDPCTFWRDQNITHIAYWWADTNMHQIENSYPAFYKEARQDLQDQTCTTLQYDSNIIGVLIGKVNP